MRLSHCLCRGLLALGLVLASASVAGTRERPPNIIFILADDLGLHDLACDGRAEHHTPHLDALANQGTRFTSAYCAQPICSPSRAALITGKSPARLHLTTYLPGRADCASQKLLHPEIRQQLPLGEETLAEHLRRAGYATACIGKWHLGGRDFSPLHQGFDFVHTGRANTEPGNEEGGKGEYDLTHKAITFIEANQHRPFFVYLAHNTPHIPYQAQEGRVRNNAGAFEPVYAALIETLDHTIGLLVAQIDTLGLREETLVIFSSDNGGLHVPELTHQRVTHNGPFRAGKGFLYEGGLRIPLIVRWPGVIPAGRVIDAPVVNTDWLPTLLDLCDLPKLPVADGVSIAALLTGKGSAPRRRFFWHFPHYTNQGGRPGGAVRDGKWKLIEFYDTGTLELYDLSRDPGELDDLSGRHPRRAARLRVALDQWRTSVNAQLNRPNPAADEAAFRALYIDFDPSRFAPARADAAQWDSIAAWRRRMDSAVRPR
jgi:arylsulfatase A-like enzyme